MRPTAALSTDSLGDTIELQEMVTTVLAIGEWLVKQQQQLSVAQRQLSEQQRQIEILQKENEQLKDSLQKLKNRSSENSSVPPSVDQVKKPSDKSKRKKGKKRGPKYDHPGKTRNGFGEADKVENVQLDSCPICGAEVEVVEDAPKKIQQVAELVDQPTEIREYQRHKYQCPECGWSGYAPTPPGVKEGFSYGARLCSVVGWLGYGGNLTWRKQEYFIEHVLGIPISQGSLAKMQRWFTQSLEPSYERWLAYVKERGVRCVDETTYCIDGIKYWLWVATSQQVCVLLLAPTRSSAEVKKLLGENFAGILSSDCFSAYNPMSAAAKQKCLTHLERDLKALHPSRFQGNRDFAQKVGDILYSARCLHSDYHSGKIGLLDLARSRDEIEFQLQAVLDDPPEKGFPADAQRLANRIKRHWDEWFTFLSHPEVKPDNNDAERALRPIVIHRKVSGGARSDWGANLVAQMFSFLETVRLQGGDAISALFDILSIAGRSPPGLNVT